MRGNNLHHWRVLILCLAGQAGVALSSDWQFTNLVSSLDFEGYQIFTIDGLPFFIPSGNRFVDAYENTRAFRNVIDIYDQHHSTNIPDTMNTNMVLLGNSNLWSAPVVLGSGDQYQVRGLEQADELVSGLNLGTNQTACAFRFLAYGVTNELPRTGSWYYFESGGQFWRRWYAYDYDYDGTFICWSNRQREQFRYEVDITRTNERGRPVIGWYSFGDTIGAYWTNTDFGFFRSPILLTTNNWCNISNLHWEYTFHATHLVTYMDWSNPIAGFWTRYDSVWSGDVDLMITNWCNVTNIFAPPALLYYRWADETRRLDRINAPFGLARLRL